MLDISLCMIAQDEEHRIERAINSVYDLVSEVVFVDGGSLDNTIAVASQYPKVKVHEIPFVQDFGLQKNNAIERASSEWILLLDADEYLERWVVNAIPFLLELPHDAYGFPRQTIMDNYLVNMIDHDVQIRLFKNYCRYVGVIHESVTGFNNYKVVNLNIKHVKTTAEQQKDNEGYWNMGQSPPPGWEKIDDTWRYIPESIQA